MRLRRGLGSGPECRCGRIRMAYKRQSHFLATFATSERPHARRAFEHLLILFHEPEGEISAAIASEAQIA